MSIFYDYFGIIEIFWIEKMITVESRSCFCTIIHTLVGAIMPIVTFLNLSSISGGNWGFFFFPLLFSDPLLILALLSGFILYNVTDRLFQHGALKTKKKWPTGFFIAIVHKLFWIAHNDKGKQVVESIYVFTCYSLVPLTCLSFFNANKVVFA